MRGIEKEYSKTHLNSIKIFVGFSTSCFLRVPLFPLAVPVIQNPLGIYWWVLILLHTSSSDLALSDSPA